MTTTRRLDVARGLRRRAVAGAGMALGLAALLPLMTGCQTVGPWAQADKSKGPNANPNANANANANASTSLSSAAHPKTDSSVSKSGFHKDVSADQQYNIHLELGRAYEMQEQYEAAIAEYQKSLDACARRGFAGGVKGKGGRQAMAHRRMGAALDRLGRFTQAETHYQAALKLSPDDSKVWNDAGYSFYLQSRWDDAERCLKTAASLDPNNTKIQTNLGLTLAASGKTDQALAALSKAGGPSIGHANLGYLLAAMGKTEQAREQYLQALQLQPSLAPARQALTALDARSKRTGQVAMASKPAVPNVGIPRVATNGVALAPRPAANATDASVRRTSGPRATPLSVTAPLAPR